jgi:histone deacetylase HOS2
MTLSFHNLWPDFFPGTGQRTDIGPRDPNVAGAHHSLNVPFSPGIVDAQWNRVFSEVTGAVIDSYNPSAIVLQCGADSLGGDRLGQFNINIKAHGSCVEFVKKKCHDRKLLILGGGGYTPRNVARCWTHETALCCNAELRPIIPAHVPYRQAFTGDDNGNGELYPNFDNLNASIHSNKNSDEDIQASINNIHEQLRYIKGAPSVQMQYIPDDYIKIRDEEDARIKDEADEFEKDDRERRRKEKNIGGRNERRGV